MKETTRLVLLDEEAALCVICHTCCQLLYLGELDDLITRCVAQLTADGHSGTFSNPHEVSVFSSVGNIEIYETNPQKLSFQEQLLA